MFLMVAAVLVTGCSKKEPGDGGSVTTRMDYQISFAELPSEGVKTSWEKSDRIYIFFDDDATTSATDASSLPYLLLEWNGSRWSINDSKAPSVIPESGTLTAIHSLYSDGGPGFKDGTFYVGHPSSPCLCATDVDYVSGSEQVRFSLEMTVPEGVADVRIPSAGIEDSAYALSVCNDDLSAGIIPVSVSFDPATGTVSVLEGNIGDELKPIAVSGEYVFCGTAVSPTDAKMTFVLNEKDDEGNNLETSYTFVKQDVMNLEGSHALPAVSSWITPTSKITTVLYEDGTLVINELPENHIANAIEHGMVLLTHGFIGNLVPSTVEQDPETGATTETLHLPWYSEIENDSSNEWQQKIRHIEFGSTMTPSIMYRAFMNLGQLLSVDTENLVITADRGEGQQPFWRMTEAFKNCKVLRDIDVSDWDVSAVTSMDYAFDQCQKLQALDVSNWNVENVADMRGVFRQCQNVPVLDLSKWKTANVKRMKELFRGVFKVTELDLSGFDTSGVTDMSMMFYQCFALTTIYASEKFVTTSVDEDDERLFYQCKAPLVGGNGTIWNESSIGLLYARIDADGKPGYFTEKQ